MFGLHSKLATEAFLRLPENIEKPKDQSEYVRKLEDRWDMHIHVRKSQLMR